jgi:hypothetical protein
MQISKRFRKTDFDASLFRQAFSFTVAKSIFTNYFILELKNVDYISEI